MLRCVLITSAARRARHHAGAYRRVNRRLIRNDQTTNSEWLVEGMFWSAMSELQHAVIHKAGFRKSGTLLLLN